MTNDTIKNISNQADKLMTDSRKEMAKSGKDWVNYIKTHPIQSVFFGIAVFYALKGMLND